MPVHPLLRLMPGVLAGALILAPAAAGARSTVHARSAAGGCTGGNIAPTAEDLDTVHAVVLCLHNKIRSAHHLPLLRANVRLRRAALAHSADMVSRGYFDHTDPSGTTFMDRLRGARYIRRSRNWRAGENIGWGTGARATPAGVMRAWMASRGHRAIILRRRFRDLGVGAVAGVPSGGTAGATYTADFGVRR